MAPHICIFEDNLFQQFLPLVHFRPVYSLRCGIFSLKEKILRAYPGANVTVQCRKSLALCIKSRKPEFSVNEIPASECLFINGRVIADQTLAKKIPWTAKQDVLYVSNGQLIAAYVSGKNLERIKKHLSAQLSLSDFDGLPTVDLHVETVSFPWELIQKNGEQIVKDFESIARKAGKMRSHIRGKVHAGVHLLGKKNIIIEQGAVIKPGTVLDAEDGPIYIGKNVKVFPQSTIIGPACILDGSSIKVGAQIYENTTIGPVCKVGGEVEESIIHSYSNKQHAGFLGHSYLGSWVNLGASTNNSDLKNNYGKVKVHVGSEQRDTGLTFAGLTMGDHSKSAIGTTFNTGTVVGVCCNIFGTGFPPKYIPSFTWCGTQKPYSVYDVEKAIQLARVVMARRKIDLIDVEANLIREIYASTAEERRQNEIQE
jgi:UDP-N-acetylglucosamine diphosphorylase / glucose-1-phosphate thymidylyltransferase / UDP-N-acetylgalactosamine diphosphorylase / glucosamine-1-phosphate N-acetyltransferase / galactosamine-1-phosphate N-acetyltransferase